MGYRSRFGGESRCGNDHIIWSNRCTSPLQSSTKLSVVESRLVVEGHNPKWSKKLLNRTQILLLLGALLRSIKQLGLHYCRNTELDWAKGQQPRRSRSLETPPHWLAVPMVFGILSMVAWNLADTFFVGQLGSDQLAKLWRGLR